MKISYGSVMLLALLLSGSSVVEASNTKMPQVPYERFGGKTTQQKQAVNQTLFQNDNIGDLKEKREKEATQAYNQTFQVASSHWNPRKSLFQTNTKKETGTTSKSQNKTNKPHHYGLFSVTIILIGSGLSLLSLKKGRKECRIP